MVEEAVIKLDISTHISQNKSLKLLADAWRKDRLAHAILLSGVPGSGKEAVAIEMAKILNCTEEEYDACGKCSACRRIASFEHPNFQYIYPLPGGSKDKDNPAASLKDEILEIIQSELAKKAANPFYRIEIPGANFVRIDSIRFLKNNAYLKSAEQGKRVILVSQADKMNDEAANAFLKLLEEPPDDTYIFLTSSKPDVMVSTIRSRCQEVKLKRLTKSGVEEALISGQVSPEDAKKYAESVNWDIGKALRLIDEGEFENRMSLANEIVTVITSGKALDISGMNRKVALVSKEGKEKLADILHLALSNLLDEKIYNIQKITELKVAECFDKAIDLIGRNIYIPMIFSSLVFETRNLLEGNQIQKRGV